MSASSHVLDPILGRGFWHHLHGFARAYPLVSTPECRHLANAFLASFRDGLMKVAEGKCPCRTVVSKAMTFCPPPLTGRIEFVTWTEALHELVNLKLGKPRFRPQLRHTLLTVDAWKAIMPEDMPVPETLEP